MRNHIISLVALVCLMVMSSSTSAATIVNGSMNDSSGANYNSFNGLTPSGWLQNFSAHSSASADIFDANTTVYGTKWAASSDGGTFVHGIGVLPGGASGEGVVQTISGLTIGRPTTICFEQAISNSLAADGPGGFWQVTFGASVLNSAIMPLPAQDTSSGWISECLTFTPTLATQDLKFLAMGNFTSPFLRIEMGLDKVSISSNSATVGVNKDLKNNTGQIANDIEILLQGNYPSLTYRYDGNTENFFGTFTLTQLASGNTQLHWSNPNNAVQPGAIAHVGFTVPGIQATILGVSWTRDGVTTGCAHQVTTDPFHSTAGSTVTYKNNGLSCASTPRYVGGLSIEYHANEVPLANLNATSVRTPIRIDVIPDAPILLQPGAQGTVNIPQAPSNARYAVLIHKVSSNASLSGADVTTDFLQFPVNFVTVTVSASPTSITAGQSVTLTATVTGNTPTGTVQFQVNGVNIGSPVALVNGVGSLTTMAISAGTNQITAVYSGDTSNAASSSAVGLTVTVLSSNGDVPTLPQWGEIMMAGLLLWTMRSANRRQRSRL